MECCTCSREAAKSRCRRCTRRTCQPCDMLTARQGLGGPPAFRMFCICWGVSMGCCLGGAPLGRAGMPGTAPCTVCPGGGRMPPSVAGPVTCGMPVAGACVQQRHGVSSVLQVWCRGKGGCTQAADAQMHARLTQMCTRTHGPRSCAGARWSERPAVAAPSASNEGAGTQQGHPRLPSQGLQLRAAQDEAG